MGEKIYLTVPNKLFEFSELQTHLNASKTRIIKYSVEMHHSGLKEHKTISAPDKRTFENKIKMQIQKWQAAAEKEANIEEANLRTEKAIKALKKIDDILIHALSVTNRVYWEMLKRATWYPEKAPDKPLQEIKKEYPPEPNKKSQEFTPIFTFLEKLFKSKKERKIQNYENKYSDAISKWEKEKSVVDKYNDLTDKHFEEKTKKFESDFAEWEKRKNDFMQEQADFNAKIDQTKELYLKQDSEAIIGYCEMLLNNSEYPDSFPKNFELEYNPNNKILIVEYELPPIECLPKVKEVKYISATKELKESHIPESQTSKMFDEVMYKITLRTIHELFNADAVNAIEAISFNGWVRQINKATGKEENNCILSVQVKKNEFRGINLSNVDPKTCFKNLKGVASNKLSSLTPIQPILQISRVDKRFVESYTVANQIDDATNLAAMDWEDFEHLIRELFEKEFQTGGGEVKVTQASRDGGVDAVAFDPDPIRGGKIVIQAKRYTNTVGVSAVRDLYGTVVNEGATKGILVSTADYGADAYDFAKGKPLTLLNGSNLLHLLEKHGHHAKIDLREAKKILAEKDK